MSKGWKLFLGALGLTAFVGVWIVGLWLGLSLVANRLPERPVFHVYGSVVTVDFPGKEKQMYFRWCDPAGYLLFANSFDETAAISGFKDARCEGAQ